MQQIWKAITAEKAGAIEAQGQAQQQAAMGGMISSGLGALGGMMGGGGGAVSTPSPAPATNMFGSGGTGFDLSSVFSKSNPYTVGAGSIPKFGFMGN